MQARTTERKGVGLDLHASRLKSAISGVHLPLLILFSPMKRHHNFLDVKEKTC